MENDIYKPQALHPLNLLFLLYQSKAFYLNIMRQEQQQKCQD